MGNPLTQEQLENAWGYLGDVCYYDTSEDWDDRRPFAAWHLDGIDIAILKELFFYDVVPICLRYCLSFSDVMGGYPHDEVVELIIKNKAAIAHSKIKLFFHEMRVWYLRKSKKDTWDKFEEVLIKYRRGDIYIAEGKVKYRDK